MKIIEIIVDLAEALKFAQASPYSFVNARNKSSKPGFLTQNTPGDLTRHELRISHSSGVGYAMNRKKDLQNVFNNSSVRGLGKEALIHAIKNGATTLDCFGDVLPNLYSKYGFVAVGRIPFSDEFAPVGWDYKKFGRPDVVFMVYRGGSRETVERRVGRFPPYRKGPRKIFYLV